MNKTEFNILVCGSEKFDDKSFVFGMLDAIYNSMESDITNIITSRFSGTCEFARDWISVINEKDDAGIGHKFFSFDDNLEKNNLSLYEQSNIPDFVVKNDPFFQKGKEKLLETGVKMVLAFPNRDGVLGASTRNIQRMAGLGNIHILDGSNAFSLIKGCRAEENGFCVPEEKQIVTSSGNGLQNRHPARKM